MSTYWSGNDIDPREGRLPKWTKQGIDNLRRQVRELNAKIAELNSVHPDSNTLLQDYTKGDTGLPDSSTIVFKFGDGSLYATVKPKDDMLQLMAVTHTSRFNMSISPQSSNVVNVRFI